VKEGSRQIEVLSSACGSLGLWTSGIRLKGQGGRDSAKFIR